MKEILVFAHNYVGNNWYEIVDEQLTKLVDSGLYYQATKIYYGAYSSNQEQLTKFIKLVKSKDVRRKIQIIMGVLSCLFTSKIGTLQNKPD